MTTQRVRRRIQGNATLFPVAPPQDTRRLHNTRCAAAFSLGFSRLLVELTRESESANSSRSAARCSQRISRSGSRLSTATNTTVCLSISPSRPRRPAAPNSNLSQTTQQCYCSILRPVCLSVCLCVPACLYTYLLCVLVSKVDKQPNNKLPSPSCSAKKVKSPLPRYRKNPGKSQLSDATTKSPRVFQV